MSRFEITVPPLPAELRRLFLYLVGRDTGGPTGVPSAQALTLSTIAAGWDEDVIGWEYGRGGAGFEARDPDGFVVWWQQGETTDPARGGLRVSAAARSFAMLWPTGVARSYAVAAFRNSHQGEQQTAKVQHETWRIAG